MGLQNISERAKELWNEWEIQVMILLSLSLQIFLIIFGKWRQHTARKWVGVLVWLAYLSADLVATVSLGIISRSQGDLKYDYPSPNNALLAFWAPFLLLHLGGPDTITAFSLEDNELWKRHLLVLVVQVGVAFYVILRSWSSNALKFVAIPVFVAGIIKYAERTWVLRYASAEHLRDSLYVNTPDEVEFNVVKELSNNESHRENITISAFDGIIDEVKYLHEAHFLFKMLLRLYSGIILSFPLHKATYRIMQNKKTAEAFKLIDVELGFMFDVLYTKATIFKLSLGSILRSISCLSSVSALVAFSIIIRKQSYLPRDKTVSYILLVGSICLEIYAVLVLFFSDWALLWLSKKRKRLAHSICRGIYSSWLYSILFKERWSVSMAQFDLLSYCDLKISTNSFTFKVKDLLGFHQTRKHVSDGLKKLIFRQLLEKREKCNDEKGHLNDVKKLVAHRGIYMLESNKCADKFRWSVDQVDFHHSLLSWHIATELCYHNDYKEHRGGANNPNSNQEMSKAISGYMAYLLFRHPFMLPKGIGELRCYETMKDTIKVIERFNGSTEAYKMLLTPLFSNEELENPETNLSVLFDGCRLARSLQSLETEESWTNRKKWKMISEVWVEILTHAASHCGWKEHARQLSQGGELLTHVSLLMAHLGLSEQCWYEKGFS